MTLEAIKSTRPRSSQWIFIGLLSVYFMADSTSTPEAAGAIVGGVLFGWLVVAGYNYWKG